MIPHAKIRSALRKLWLWSPMRREALKRAKWNSMAKYYRCDICCRPTDKPNVDHIEAVGKTPGAKNADGATWDVLIARLFCGTDGLRVLCERCHLTVTKAGREAS